MAPFGNLAPFEGGQECQGGQLPPWHPFSRIWHPSKSALRFWKGPFSNSFWIRDADIPESALGHVEITYWGDPDFDPIVRFGKLSPKMVKSLEEQFEHIWGQSETAR